MNKIRIHIIAGFLGSGKTTFLNAVLSYALRQKKEGNKFFKHIRPAVVENEFGHINLDADILLSEINESEGNSSLEDKSVKIMELADGCVCCSLSSNLKKSIYDLLLNYNNITDIFIEPSGVARLADLRKNILDLIHLQKQRRSELVSEHENTLKDKIKAKFRTYASSFDPYDEIASLPDFNLASCICLVDAGNYHYYKNNYQSFYTSQLSLANTVVINFRKDSSLSPVKNIALDFEDELRACALDIQDLKKQFPAVKSWLLCQHCRDLNMSVLWQKILAPELLSAEVGKIKKDAAKFTALRVSTESKPNFSSHALDLGSHLRRNEFTLLRNYLRNYNQEEDGYLIRAKAFISFDDGDSEVNKVDSSVYLYELCNTEDSLCVYKSDKLTTAAFKDKMNKLVIIGTDLNFIKIQENILEILGLSDIVKNKKALIENET